MKILKKTRFLLAAAAIVVVSTILYAAFTFNANTDSQPTTTLAPYALSSTDLSGNSINAYGPWFENGAWQGDLIEYTVCGENPNPADANCPSGSAGKRFTDAGVGSNPPVAGTNNWLARATFAAKEGSNPVSTAYWEEKTGGRHIFTVTNGAQVNFLWNNLSVLQKLALDTDIADPTDLYSQGSAPSVATGSAYDSPVLNFIRGDRSNEKSSKGGTYRIRFNLLGDIINSNPVYIGAPTEAYNFDSFPTFKATVSDPTTGRQPRLAVGANDGLLHVFDPSNGSEVYAYLPSMLIVDPDATTVNGYPVLGGQLAESKLNRLREIPYVHNYYVDGQLTAASARVNSNWKTVLTGGLGAGAKGLFALDVTYATPTGTKVLFEKTGNDIGHIYGAPTIARLADGKWYIVTGNGFGSTSANAQLLLISLDSPDTVTSLPACATANCSTGEAKGLAAPALLDTNGDYKVDYAFAGDDNGDMWRFNLNDNTVIKIYSGERDNNGNPLQPITSAPELGFQPNGGYMVYFGTGTNQHTWPPADGAYPTQAIYGIWDRGPGDTIVDQKLDSNTPVFDNSLQSVDGTACTLTTDPPPDPIRYMDSVSQVDFLCLANNSSCAKGWKVELDKPGEQVLGSPKLRAGRITVVTHGPGTDGKGDSWLMSLDYLTGGSGDQIVFNTSGDQAGDLDDCDKYGTKFPVGLGFGDGNISQPILGRVGPGADIMFINGLRLPVISATRLLGGHLDVETDSPNGGSTAPENTSIYAYTDSDFHETEGYYKLAAADKDGAGGAVDGHFHRYDDANNAYDDVNGKIFVDFFQLEPQRGKASFTGVPVTGSGSCPAGSVSAGSGCIEAVVPELNRAYDTLSGTPQSEVYGNSPPTPLDKDKEFIVVLANADLSPGATLQIGCTNWPVVGYQDMVTDILETSSDPIAALRAKGLVYTLAGIAAVNGGTCPDFTPATVRVKFTYRSILDNGVVGTRSQCVLGLHDYRDKVCYTDEQVLRSAPNPFPSMGAYTDPDTGITESYSWDSFSYSSCNDKWFPDPTVVAADNSTPAITPPDGYIRNPDHDLHITESLEGAGEKYRWRNGALTVQFIDASSFTAGSYCKAATYSSTTCPLQDPNTLPYASGKTKGRFGGTYARAFRLVSKAVTLTDISGNRLTNGNGLLYESTIFWHYSDLADNLRRGAPSSIPCYGDSSYNAALTQELGGLTLGEYNDLITAAGISNINQYAAKLEALQLALDSGDEADINQALMDLATLLAGNDALKEYVRYREYAPGHVPEQHLLPLDKGLGSGGNTPANDVEVKPLLDRSTLGPNLTAGRRTWIDLSD